MDIKLLIKNIFYEITGVNDCQDFNNLIKINNNSLAVSGDLSFPSKLVAWKNHLTLKKVCDKSEKNPRNILEYYLKVNNVNSDNYSDAEIAKEALELLISRSKSWPIQLQTRSLIISKEKIRLHVNRTFVTSNIIKEVIKHDKKYGKNIFKAPINSESCKSLILKVNEDSESNLTTSRLKQLKNICDNIFRLQGYVIKSSDDLEKTDFKYLLTTKSEGKLNEDVEKYVCGVVKNPKTNSKEISLTYEEYLGKKIEEIEEVNGCRLLTDSEKDEDEKLSSENCRNLGKAIITFEFFSVKPSHPLFIKINPDVDKQVSNNKGGAFVLYNKARISAVLEKFEQEKLAGRYPELYNIQDVDFDTLNLEEEWELVYNFILGYPLTISNSIDYKARHELHPQNICLFLSCLSQKFSIYYRSSRILTEGRPHLLPTLMARIYLLKALEIIYNNAFDILNITPIKSRM